MFVLTTDPKDTELEEFRFVITGNHYQKKGNPIPYFRQTQRSKWSSQAKRYHAWQNFVRVLARSKTKINFNKQSKAKEKVYMMIDIYFANKKHGDPDNIFKGIADSLFGDDKYVAGSFDFDYDKENPRVEVALLFTKENT